MGGRERSGPQGLSAGNAVEGLKKRKLAQKPGRGEGKVWFIEGNTALRRGGGP